MDATYQHEDLIDTWFQELKPRNIFLLWEVLNTLRLEIQLHPIMIGDLPFFSIPHEKIREKGVSDTDKIHVIRSLVEIHILSICGKKDSGISQAELDKNELTLITNPNIMMLPRLDAFEYLYSRVAGSINDYVKRNPTKDKKVIGEDESTNSSVISLDSVIPNTGKYKVHRRMAKHFNKKDIVSNFTLASCIDPTVLSNNKRRKLNKSDYSSNKVKFNKRIKARLLILKKFWRHLGFTVKFNANETQKMPVSH